ncbi:lipoate--protein ligase family protein [Thermophagus xiamenensis]|uniref:Lipoate-protein ligase n=1 Tax=Thermophagus xiamenensis TaxID=385682 RepID=A0A1I2CYV8_9BACT|nr:biotin/lipoate A/B protein ligase family protein [Thermophagus xiamenensis]SFE73456.1 lipoate-protein ligase [Thermophagus xiamenensis]
MEHKKTLYVISKSNDPAYNLATEEVLLRNYEENIVFLYINKPSVIVGKHQNTLSEINLSFLKSHNIPVYRRLSGGGTVYHDLGNINYCLIENGEAGKLVDFVRATTPVVEVLKHLGINARHGKRNDLLCGYKKISGNACHVYKSRSMHHGTLLYNSNLSYLTESLKTKNIHFKDRAVKSVRSEVENISRIIKSKKQTTEFLLEIGEYLKKKYNAQPWNLTTKDIEKIDELIKNKYETWQWNYGYSPMYEFKKAYKTGNYTFLSQLKVEKGIIQHIEIKSNYPNANFIKKAEKVIHMAYHEKEYIQNCLSDLPSEIQEGIINSLF